VIAFPAIGTGAYGYPREQAAPVVSSAIESFLHASPVFKEIRLVFWQSADARTFVQHHTFSSAFP